MTIRYSNAADGDVPTFRVRRPEDLLALAPVILGFRLEQDVMIMTFGGLRPFSARMDLPRCCGGDDAAAIAEALVGPARAHRATAVVLLFHSDDDVGVRRAWRALSRACADAGIHVIDALRADGRRYYPLLARDRRLREQGVPYDISDHPFLAQAVVEGRVVHASRAALAAGFEPDRAAQVAVADALERGTERHPPDRLEQPLRLLLQGTWVQELVQAHVAAATRPEVEEAARLVHLLQEIRVRDAAWSLIRRHNAREHHDFWRELSRRTPADLAAPPLALAGWAAWLAGDGASAWIAVDRCREVRPGYTLAGLLADALERAIPPEYGEPTCDWRAGLLDDDWDDPEAADRGEGWDDEDPGEDETWASLR